MAQIEAILEFNERDMRRLIRLTRSPRLVGNLVRAGLTDMGRFAIRRISLVAPRDTSALANSYVFEVARGIIPKMLTIISRIGYAPFVEFGAKAHFPPPPALKGWAGRHGFPASPVGEFQVALAIANPKPGAKSLVGQPHVIPTIERILRNSSRHWQRAFSQLEKVWRSG